jgi:hypothetical protein
MFLWIICYSVSVTIVYADEKINAEMKSLSILCIGGRRQSMLAGGEGGEYGAEKKSRQIEKGERLAIYSVRKMDLILRSIERRPQMLFSMARRFKL